MNTKRFIKNIFTRKLHTLFFFITSNCNSRCKGCFYWKNINKVKELSLEDIKVMFGRMPDINHISISGGEPFLRKDIVEICEVFAKGNNVKSITIPTNGLMPDIIYKNTKKT